MKVNIPGFTQKESCKTCPGEIRKTVNGKIATKYCYCLGMEIAYRMLGDELYPHFDPSSEKIKAVLASDGFQSKKLFIKETKKDNFRKVMATYVFRHRLKRFLITDSYRIMEAYLGLDEDYKTHRQMVDANDMIVVRMGETERDVNRFDETFKQFLVLAEMKEDLVLWLVSSRGPQDKFYKDFYSLHSQPFFSNPIHFKGAQL